METSVSIMSSNNALPPRQLTTDAQVYEFVKKVHGDVVKRFNEEKAVALGEALKECRDAVLESAVDTTTSHPRYFGRRLQSSGKATTVSDLLLCLPCQNQGNSASLDSDAAHPEDNGPNNRATMPSSHNAKTLLPQVTVTFQNPKGQRWKTTEPAMPLEGTHDPRPPGTTPAFLKQHYATEDEQALTHVPYFNDDDHEDVVSEHFDVSARERALELGPEYRQYETYRIIEETLKEIQEETRGTVSANRIEEALAEVMDIDPDLIQNRQENKDIPSPVKEPVHETEYLAAVDSYRQCFCRRCFTYDCNMHGGCQSKPDIKIQGELAMEKERSSFWKKVSEVETHLFYQEVQYFLLTRRLFQHDDIDEATDTANPSESTGLNIPRKRPLEDAVARLDEECAGMKELTASQKAICERTFVIHQGDYDKIALTLRAPRKLVEDYVTSQGMNLDEFKHIQPEPQAAAKKRRASKKRNKSMKNYNPALLKRVVNAQIHPFFVPCDHSGPCTDAEVCSCTQNSFFCTKHCVWGEKSVNFFKGCSCSGKCNTKSCACFAANRECDPDLCTSCGTCTDSPGQPATNQRCRNDNISMRRHAHLLLGKSTIEEAGWGMFTKRALKKGDYVQEYIGEVISQSEAERRGKIFDKMNLSYLFNLSSDLVVDASRKGNKMRFANHSKTDPNCEVKMTWVNGDIRIGLFASCDIEAQTEVRFVLVCDLYIWLCCTNGWLACSFVCL